MFGPIRAVAIDDEPGHLLSITTGLAAIGVPCIGYWYDRDTSELRPKPKEGGLPYVRVVFSDLNLAELGGVPDTQTLWSGVTNVLKQLLSEDSGPYLLVFWTQVGSKVADVAAMLYERAEQLDGIPCPIAVVELAKGPFIVKPPTGADFYEGLREYYSELHANIAQLESAVKTVIATDPQLNAVAAWESRAGDAAALAVNEVHRCARADEANPQQATDALRKVLAKIAVQASGKTSAVAAPARALDAGLIDILVDQFGVSVDQADYQADIAASIGAAVSAPIAFGDDVGMFAELNTFFHVDREVGTAKSWDRGAVIPAKPPLDTNILGFAAKDLITTEFLFPYELFPEAEHAAVRDLHREFRQLPEIVLIELGADCDHAQDHDRTRRYLVGLEVPDKYMKLARYWENNKLRNESLQLLGPWKINGVVTHLFVSCRRFWTWQKRTAPVAAVRYRLRPTLVDKLLHHYSVWSTRPGIVEFR